MAAQYPAGLIHKIAGDQSRAAVLPQEGHVIPVGNEADVLAVRLLGVGQAVGGGQSPERRLLIVAGRKQQMGELVLGQLAEKIGLVLPPVRARSSCQRPEGDCRTRA